MAEDTFIYTQTNKKNKVDSLIQSFQGPESNQHHT